MTNRPGFFISVEGIDGIGKSTLVSKIAREFERCDTFDEMLIPNLCDVLRGGSEAALEKRLEGMIADIHLSPEGESREEELKTIMKKRVGYINGFIKPHLDQGKVFISDRFIDSTYAYQGARGFRKSEIDYMLRAFGISLEPDLTIYLRYSGPFRYLKEVISRDCNYSEKSLGHFYKEFLTYDQAMDHIIAPFFRGVCKIYDELALANRGRFFIIPVSTSTRLDEVSKMALAGLFNCSRFKAYCETNNDSYCTVRS